MTSGVMFTADVRFEGWTTETWGRFIDLWKPRAEPAIEATRPRGGVVAVVDGGRIVKLIHTRKGRIVPDIAWPMPLAELTQQHGGSWGLLIARGALDEVSEQFGARVKREHDLVAQSLILVNIVREQMLAKTIEFWPARLEGVPVPTEGMVRRSLDTACADGHVIVLGLFERDQLYTALCARRRGDAFDVVAGPEDLRLSMGLLSGDWQRDHRHLVRAVERTYGPLSLGCFAEASRFKTLMLDATPGAWSKAVALREVILSPVPTAIGLALGFDGARYAYESVRAVTDRVDRFGFVDSMLANVRKRASAALGDKDVTGVLGFNPIEVLRALIRR
jgi:hypothetical protein